jgi:DNA invertase Pin-like site-specific DNA recombinase
VGVRPELHRLLDQLRKGDVLVVWKLDRLSGPLRAVLTIMERLGEAGAGFRSLTETIDTTTPAGRMMMQMVGAFAELERAMLKERTKAGLDAASEECVFRANPISVPKASRSRFRSDADHRSDLKPITHGALEDGPPTRASAAPG